MSKTTSLPDGFKEQTPEWHFDKFVEFTELKGELGEPSPHLAIVGHMGRDCPVEDRVWLLGCYGATYCLPSAQAIWEHWDVNEVQSREFVTWIFANWKGIITRTERRCVRTPAKMVDCLTSYADWTLTEYPKLLELNIDDPKEYYDAVWKSVNSIRYFGRYIVIRVIEGLRRYCNVPAMLYDVRSVGGWSPKKCMMYLYPEHVEVLMQDNAKANKFMDELVNELVEDVKEYIPNVDSYVIAAMLCEYKGAFENRHQYPGWTLDQEPLLYDKAIAYWGEEGMDADMLWEARKAIFPHKVLGEISGWNGTRWDLAKVLRDYGYNWSDLKYDYVSTKAKGSFSEPILWSDGEIL